MHILCKIKQFKIEKMAVDSYTFLCPTCKFLPGNGNCGTELTRDRVLARTIFECSDLVWCNPVFASLDYLHDSKICLKIFSK